MSDVNVTKRVEPSIHSSTLDGFRIVNQIPPKSPEDADERQAERRGNGQPIRTQPPSVMIKGAPIEVSMGGSGAVVVRRPPPPIGAIGGAPRATGPIAARQAPAPAPPALTADQVELCSLLVRDHLDAAATDAEKVLAKSTLTALGALGALGELGLVK